MKLTAAILTCLISTASLAQIPTSGLVGHYPFSGNANDASGLNMHGTVVGATLTEDRFGNANSAYSFNGIGNHILLPDSNLVGLNIYSYSVWIKPYAVPNNYSGLVYSVGNTTQNQDQSLSYQPATTLFAGSYNQGNLLPFQSKAISAPMPANQWIHVVVTRDMTSIRMYVNGSLLPAVPDHATNNQPANYGTVSRAVIGGRSTLSSDSYFHGAIDDMRQYDRVLTQSEVMSLFQENLNGNQITGIIFRDLNGNGLRDSGEVVVPHVLLQVNQGNTFASTNLDGSYSAYTIDDSIYVSIPQLPLYHTVSPAYRYATFAGLGQTDSLNHFALSPIPNMNDLQVVLTDYTAPRPGFDHMLRVTYHNVGTTTLSGHAMLVPDSLYAFLSAVPAQDSIVSGTIYWSFTNLQPGHSADIDVLLNLSTAAVLGNTAFSTAMVTPVTGDETPNNNTYSIDPIIIGSYDPNDKAVNYEEITPSQVAAAIPLTYTIRFQNTGTAEAINVMIADTLSQMLQIPTFRVESVSHAYTYQVKNNGIVEFYFNNIMLPDSNTNEPASHGFIKYSIRPHTSLQLGKIIENTAHIYFDFNDPITTNTTSTEVKLPTAVPTNIDNPLAVSLFPNPAASEVTLMVANASTSVISTRIVNMLGQIVYTEESRTASPGYRQNLHVAGYSAGIYFITVSDGVHARTQKLVIQK